MKVLCICLDGYDINFAKKKTKLLDNMLQSHFKVIHVSNVEYMF